MDEADGNFCIVLCIVTIATGGRVKTSSHQLFNGIYGAQGRERNRDFSASDQLASHHLVGLLGSVPAHHFIFLISEFSYPVPDVEFLKSSLHLISLMGSSSVDLIEDFLIISSLSHLFLDIGCRMKKEEDQQKEVKRTIECDDFHSGPVSIRLINPRIEYHGYGIHRCSICD
ncbi:hypothetical protein M514_27796 [Trichuris suis]|uniref:Uncharacterized protein n=1 Tax=Trichuris suis TaxID=68888 RepID=A0A085MS34_9BILA|nr:hypothetical protein M514_27796 [Trichuris suis]